MAQRVNPREIIRRTAVETRRSEVPVLAVQADQDPAMSAGALSDAAAGVLQKLSSVALKRQAVVDAEQEYEGQTQRVQEDVEGSPRQAEEAVKQQSEAWRRGYLRADGLVRIRDWQVAVAAEVAKAEPGSDIEPIIRSKMAEITSSPEFADPQVRGALLPVAQRAVQQIRLQHQKDSMQESLTRQSEALTAIIRDGIKGGKFLTSEGMDALYAMLDQEDFAYLSKREVDELFATALKEELAAGNRDPAEVLKFLEGRTDEDGVSIMDGRHGEEIRNAAAAGSQVIAKRTDEARKQAMAEAEWSLQSLADRGQLSRGEIDKWASRFGLEGGELLSFRRYWNNQQEQTLRRWEAEAKERQREERIRRAIAAGNPFSTSDAQLRKQAAAEFDSTPLQNRGQVIMKWAKLGVPIPQLTRILQRADPAFPEGFKQAAEVYENLRKVSPRYAATVAGGEAAAMMDQYLFDTRRGGLSHQDSAKALTAPKREREEAGAAVRGAWKSTIAEFAEVDGKPRDARELHRIRLQAERIALRGGISGEAAIRAAVGQIDAQTTKVGGRRVPNIGMPQGAEPAVDRLLENVAKKLGRDPEELSALPNPRNPGQWQIVGPNNFPIADPDTGRAIGFDPRAIASMHRRFEADKAETAARREQLSNQLPWNLRGTALPAKPGGRSGQIEVPEQYRAAYDELRSLPEVPEAFLDYIQSRND